MLLKQPPFVTVPIYSFILFIYCHLLPFIAKTTSIILVSKSAEMPVMSLFFYKGIPYIPITPFMA